MHFVFKAVKISLSIHVSVVAPELAFPHNNSLAASRWQQQQQQQHPSFLKQNLCLMFRLISDHPILPILLLLNVVTVYLLRYYPKITAVLSSIYCFWTVYQDPIIEKVSQIYELAVSDSLNTQFFTSQLVVNDLPVRARCVTAVQSTVVLMREEDGQASPPTHTALCLSLCPPSLA